MTETELRVKILELLKSGTFTKQAIKETLWVENDRRLDFVLHSLRKEKLVFYTAQGYTLTPTTKTRRTRKAVKKQNQFSVIILRIIFGLLSIGASCVSVRNTSRYLLESYLPFWGVFISCLMSLFMISSSAMTVYFWQSGNANRANYFKAIGIWFLWAIVTFYSIASTSIGMYNAQKDDFIKKTTIENIDNSNEMLYNEYKSQAEGIQVLIDNKQITLARLNEEVKLYEPGTAKYANTSWSISVAEKYIETKQAELNGLVAKRTEVIAKDETTEIVAKTFYEEMEVLFHVPAAMVQFVLSLVAAIFIDIIAPVGASLALFLKEE